MDRQRSPAAASSSTTVGTAARPPRTFSLAEAGTDDLRSIRQFVSLVAKALGADETRAADLVQAVDEWSTNVLLHGYRGLPGPLDISIERRAESVAVAVRDRAPHFDPTTWPEPDLERPLLERAPGGLGIHLTRACVDLIEHAPASPSGNQLTFVRHLVPGSQESAP